MTDNDEQEKPRTEGVRIIGAQEAAEAAGRPDVVRRRRGGEKRFGDRPDKPKPSSDLPKITISTTEGDATSGGPDEEYPGGYGDPSVPSLGHARIIPAGDDPTEAMAEEELAAELGSDDLIEVRWDTNQESSGDGGYYEEPPTFEPSYDPALLHSGPHQRDDVFGATGDSSLGLGLDDDLGVEDDDDSFVLPHWTEPPTGQVPKVVIGDDIDDTDSLASYGTQPRWRDEGERSSATDFDDLIEDGPKLGALRGASDFDDFDDDDDFFADGPYTDSSFIVDGSDQVEELEDDLLVDDDVDAAPPQSPKGPGQRQRRPSKRPPEDPQPKSGGGDRPLGLAIGVGVALVAVGLACFWFGGLTTALLVTVIVTAASLEYFSAVRSAGHNPATLLGGVAVAGLIFATYTSATGAYPVVLGLTVLSAMLWYLWVAPGEGAVQNLGLTLLGVLWVGFLGSFATLFVGIGRQLQDSSASITSNPGIGVLIAAVIAAVSHDVGAYFCGKYLGKTPLSAASPNKTQEGLIGGILVSVVMTFVIVGVIGVAPIGGNIGRVFIFAVLCAVVAPFGDLCESFVKRDLGIKDMGSILPGHGGLLDRFDALLFVLPTAYFVTVLFDVWSGIS